MRSLNIDISAPLSFMKPTFDYARVGNLQRPFLIHKKDPDLYGVQEGQIGGRFSLTTAPFPSGLYRTRPEVIPVAGYLYYKGRRLEFDIFDGIHPENWDLLRRDKS